MDIGKTSVWCLSVGLLVGCQSGPFISLEHFSEGYGDTPPIPQSGGSGPPEFQRIIDLPTGDVTLPSQLPELLAAYRLKLLETAHPLSPALAQEYADKEIAGLRMRYAGRDDALRADLTRRLRPTVARPGTPAGTKYKTPRYPADEGQSATGQRRAP